MPRPAYSSPAVHPLHLADVVYPEGHPRYGETGPVFAFLVAHPDGSVLVDTASGHRTNSSTASINPSATRSRKRSPGSAWRLPTSVSSLTRTSTSITAA